VLGWEKGFACSNRAWPTETDRSFMSAFRDSVEAMIPALRRYARALTRDADIADDLVQDTLVRALRSERLFLGGDVRSWLYTILTNLNKNRRRSLARRPQFMPLLDNNPDASGTEAEGRDIARALSTLVEEQRSALLLVTLEGLSYRRHPGRADRHRDVAPRPRSRPCQGLPGRRTAILAASQMSTSLMHQGGRENGNAASKMIEFRARELFLSPDRREPSQLTGPINPAGIRQRRHD
jgi:RNA polymerase sigma-70 factor, ECF subfamily